MTHTQTIALSAPNGNLNVIGAAVAARPSVRGKFLYAGDEKIWIRGVSYGAFRPDGQGREYHDLGRVERDFALMAANGINAVRIPHTTPPRALLDIAAMHGLRVMIGLSAEQYVGYLTDRRDAPDIEALVRQRVQTCAGHPALLCYGIGNEVSASVARWIGARRLERYLERLYRVVKAEDPSGLVTYVNYPSTEYLHLPFLDFLCFNVYLESKDRLEAYLARLQNVAGDRPLVMGEVGLDSIRNGEDRQAEVLDWQVRASFGAGCAGLFIFAWTDEWFRGLTVEDWAFGLTRHDRSPKPALRSVREAFADVPLGRRHRRWPRMSVVVCTHNGARTIRRCLEALLQLEYPDFEVIVVNDGSTDGTAAIVEEYDCLLFTTENLGLASARNTGLSVAGGDIIAYVDDDAYPDRQWLLYLADAFLTTTHAAIGGPNVPPVGDGLVADCVAGAPGGPIHVLISDREAEHIPGCNMAFRREALWEIGGFDVQFRAAGDDVDICWRLQERGCTIGFSPAAMVWHHRRNSVLGYLKQQYGYRRAEALLERTWPEKYNSLGHVTWAGRIYGNGLAHAIGKRRRIYHGPWGSAPFQSIYAPAPSLIGSLPLLPEWYLLILALAVASSVGAFWRPLLFALPLLALAALMSLVSAVVAGARARFPTPECSAGVRFRRCSLTVLLHLLQPLVRLIGRLHDGLTLWRWRGVPTLAPPSAQQRAVWISRGRPQEGWLGTLAEALRAQRARVLCGGAFDRWDLEVRSGIFGAARLLMAVEDHGAGAQFVRVRYWPRLLMRGVAIVVALGSLAVTAAFYFDWLMAAAFGTAVAAVTLRGALESAGAMATLARGIEDAGLGAGERIKAPDDEQRATSVPSAFTQGAETDMRAGIRS